MLRPGPVLTLEAEDLADEAVRRRLEARKTACFVGVAKPAARIGAMYEAASAHCTGAIAVYVERVADARGIEARLAGAHGAERVAVLTGTLRGRERSALVAGAVWERFAPKRDRTQALPAVYLVMTSAGEVGVDLDADHAVMDLALLDSMIQRAGRVNRAGLGSATVTIVHTACDTGSVERPETVAGRLCAARRETLGVLRSLADLSPGTLRGVDQATLGRCSVSRVTNARVDRVVVEAYALTSADLVRPPVEVYLRGVEEAPEVPETWLAWRRDVADLVRAGPEAAEAALSFYRPRAAELARVPVREAKKIVEEALRRQEGRGLPLVVVRADGEVHATRVHAAAELPSLAYATVLVPSGAGGLAGSGLPDASASGAVADVGDTPDRIRYAAAEPGDKAGDGPELPAWAGAAVELRIPIPGDEDGCEERTWVYALRRAGPDLAIGAGEMSWLGGVTQTLEEHGRLVGEAIRRIARALGLDPRLVEALGLAGEWHDAGKSRRVWQLAAGVPPGGPPLAKSRRGRFRPGWLGGYRHEFASVADAERSLAADTAHRDLILHLIAAHHGWARPGFPRPEQWDPDASPGANRALAERIADRYARLSAEHGPWRLAWFEAILKAADAWVSSGRARVMEWQIDPENPAEVLACAGLAHLAWRSDRHARTGFVIGDDGEVRFEAPQLAELSRPLELEEVEGGAVRLGGVELDWWLPWGLNPGLKTWSGKQTGWTVHRSLRQAAGRTVPGDQWLTIEAPANDRKKGRLGLDPASNWTTLELGWSPNKHSSVHMCCRPWVELLASVGLQAFALRGSRDGYRYHLWRAAALPAAVAAFGGRGRCVHSLAGYRVTTGKNGPNTVFRRASPHVKARP